MKKQYFSVHRPKIYAIINLIGGSLFLFVLLAIFITISVYSSLDLFFEILEEFPEFFILILFLGIVFISRAISFFRKKQMVIAEVDENGMYYLNLYNNIKYIYFVEIKDIYLKIEIIHKNGRTQTVSIAISNEEKAEYVSLVKKNLIKKGIK